MIRLDATLLTLACMAVLAWIYIRNRETVRRERSTIFDQCLDLFVDIQVSQDAINFPTLRGRYGSWAINLVPIVDHIAVRKIPSLWLQVTVETPIPYAGSLDYLVRPQNIEFYSPSSILRTNLEVPEGWPPHAVLRTDDIEAMPPQEVIAPHIALFEEPKMKELLITPRGVRLVYQLDQATRSHYMVLRQLRFDDFVIPRELAVHLLDAAVTLAESLKASATPVQVEEKNDR